MGQTCEAGVNAPGDEQILCQALGLDTNQGNHLPAAIRSDAQQCANDCTEWCCSTAELCVTGQGQYSVCGTKFLRPNYTAEQEYEALGVESVPATLTKGQAIGTGSQVVISSTMVQTGGPSSISALPPDNTSGKPPRSTNEAGLGGGAYAGIAIGAVAVLLLIAGCVWFFLKRRAKKETTPTPATEPRLPQEDFGPVEVEAKYFGASEAPANTYHELSARDKPIEAPGAHQRHELGRSIS